MNNKLKLLLELEAKIDELQANKDVLEYYIKEINESSITESITDMLISLDNSKQCTENLIDSLC